MRVTNGFPLGCSLLLPVDAANSVRTLKAKGIEAEIAVMNALQKSAHIVTLHAADKTHHGRFDEYWLLMELCPDGHVVDLMCSTRFCTMDSAMLGLAHVVDLMCSARF
jgi:hypothetical protein